MITINTYIFLSILGITVLSMFLNIYSTIKVFGLLNEDQEEEIHELEVENMFYREENKKFTARLSQYNNVIMEVDAKIGVGIDFPPDPTSDVTIVKNIAATYIDEEYSEKHHTLGHDMENIYPLQDPEEHAKS